MLLPMLLALLLQLTPTSSSPTIRWWMSVTEVENNMALIESGVPYTIVRPGGMERPDDDYYKEHNLVLDKEDSRFGGQVSRLQVAWVS